MDFKMFFFKSIAKYSEVDMITNRSRKLIIKTVSATAIKMISNDSSLPDFWGIMMSSIIYLVKYGLINEAAEVIRVRNRIINNSRL